MLHFTYRRNDYLRRIRHQYRHRALARYPLRAATAASGKQRDIHLEEET
jgi:hypothetical protein